MNREQKCISLPLAKELQKVAKEAGFELPESEYVYVDMGISKTDKEYPNDKFVLQLKSVNKENGNRKYILAYDTSELGEMLPKGYSSWKYTDSDATLKWTCSLNENSVAKLGTESEARGKMLIYLIKNKLI